MSSIANHRRARTSLLIGSGATALAAMLAAVPASAQSAGDHIAGTHVVISHQDAAFGGAIADTSGTVIEAAPASTRLSRIALTGNAVSAVARVNRADAALVLAGEEQPVDGSISSLSSGPRGILATAGGLLIVSQRATGSAVIARNLDGRIGLNAGTADTSSVEASANMVEAVAAGNDASASLEARQIASGTSAAIVGYQASDAASDRSAINAATVELSADSATGSELSMTGNLLRAVSQGNAFSSNFSVDAATVEMAAGTGPASLVPASASGDPIVTATYATLSHQEQAGSVTAHLGLSDGSDRIAMTVLGDLEDSIAAIDGGELAAAAYRNLSANAMTLNVGAIAASSSGSAVASVTNLQRSGGSNVNAAVLGGIETRIQGEVEESRLSLSDNEARSVSFANLAQGNLLRVHGMAIDTNIGNGGPPVAAAVTGSDGSSTATGAFSLQNVQDFADGKIGASSTSVFSVVASGSVETAAIAADRNGTAVAATGNAAENRVELNGSMVRASAGLNNLQTGDGAVRASAGALDSPIGTVIDLSAPVHGSSLSVSDNAIAATAIGNSAANTEEIDAAGLADGGGHAGAAAGSLDDGYGATATFALASNQKLGQLEGRAVPVASLAAGRFGVSGDVAADTAMAINGNVQRAAAIGNTVTNQVSVSAAIFGGESAEVPGTSLSSAQYGQVAASARSDMFLMTPASLEGSSASVSGSVNQAAAGINEGDNLLVIGAIDTGLPTAPDARAAVGTSLAVEAGNVLANLQFAGGSVRSITNMALGSGDGEGGLAGSRFAAEGNVVQAEAFANRASNTVHFDAVTGMNATAGLGNTQTSTANVSAGARIDAGVAGSGTLPEAGEESAFALNDNKASALAQGNVADNLLELNAARGLSSGSVADIGRFDSQVQADAPLLNAQTNYGAVSASASAVFGSGTISGELTQSTVAFRGNNVSAAAYGNSANNRAAITSPSGFPSAALVSTQTNAGPVTAFASGTWTAPAGAVFGSSIAASGNALSASAIGNQSTSALIVTR